MKWRILFSLSLGLYSGIALAQQGKEDAVRVFDEANRLVESGAYEEAVNLYLAALDTGYMSGDLYHNLASTYFRLDEIGQAVRYYERARRLLGEDPQLMHNIQIVETRVRNPFSELPKPFWRMWWDQLFGQLHALSFLIAGISLYLAACLLHVQRIWQNTQSGWHRRVRTGMYGMGLLLLLIAVLISGERSSVQGAVVLEPTVLTTETGQIEVPEGIKVTLAGETSSGTEVRLPNGVQGVVDTDILGDY